MKKVLDNRSRLKVSLRHGGRKNDMEEKVMFILQHYLKELVFRVHSWQHSLEVISTAI